MSQLEEFSEKIIQLALDTGCQYADARAESTTRSGIVIENGEIEYLSTHEDSGIGIRVINSGAWGFYSIANPQNFDDVKAGLFQASKSALHSSELKKSKIVLAESPTILDNIDYPVKANPTIEDLISIGQSCNKIIQEKEKIIKSNVALSFKKTSKYFVNSDGSKINQNHTDVVADLAATAHESGLTQSINITEGGRGGLEKINKEIDLEKTADEISNKAIELLSAKPAKEDKKTVVMNPDFVSLLTHEILGHPSEADRVLGKEMAWAGGSWWAGKLGEHIGSEELSVFDDPTIEGSLGWYQYDDEGVKSSRTNLIEQGVLTKHMQSRETAGMFDSNSSANMRATSYRFMPLIRMACTCIGEGSWNPDEMIKDVKDGYYISNMKIPSIDMKRYNWSISCQYAQRIENGELKELLRDVIVMGIAPEFFKSIDACGTDFTVRPITNCGKGDPMQSMIMGNGGPTVRGVATVKSVGA